jgi:protocatechuate 3,4-dioxygenase beta subunit
MDEIKETEAARMTRRGSLARFASLAATAAGASAWTSGSLFGAPAAEAAGTGPAAVASGLVTCVLTPELTEGPYYLPNEKVRRNITEGRPGTPLTLRATVVDASSCKAVKGAAVDVWHCDAGGVYSGVQGNSGAFLRGIQKTDAKGVVTFQTLYPGWYTGRAVHIHVKVHLGGSVVHTGQLFFPDAVTDAAYRAAPYRSRPGPDVRNGSDSIYRNGGSKGMLAVRAAGSGYVATIAMGVHRS